MDERIEVNRLRWNEMAVLHASTYQIDDVAQSGADWLKPFEIDELGSVEGQRICHLQCHIGGGSIALAQRGASVVGVDFSSASLEIARDRVIRAGLSERVSFACATVDDAPQLLSEPFDGVYTSWGVLGWLPSLTSWARSVASLLRAGGWLYLAETHPYAQVLRWSDMPYGGGVATFSESQGDYTANNAVFEHPASWYFSHGLGEIVTAVIDQGMRLVWLHEHPEVAWHLNDQEHLIEDAHGMWRDPGKDAPLSFSLSAIRV
jgi:2-polyprenyl-3-methyl-5-hydroxy-6-metoxy-1,4-benzoquinol methylase